MRRLCSIALTLILCVALVPSGAFATSVPGPADGQARPPQELGTDLSATQLSVRVESKADLPELEEEIRRTGGKISSRSTDGEAVLVDAPKGTDSAEYADLLSTMADVEFASPVGIIRAFAIPNDPNYPNQWGLRAIEATSAWDHTWGSPDVTIAIIDTGVDLDHPDLVGKIAPGGWDFVDGDAVPDDPHGHGTAVAGIAAATHNNGLFGTGVAPGVLILPMRVLRADGLGDTFHLAQAIRLAADKGAKVINMSLGGGASDPEVAHAIEYALQRNVVLVAAAGNTGPTGTVQYPARERGVTAVGAMDQHRVIASESSRGPDLDVVAPGVGIHTTAVGGQWGSYRGTSMAAPFVAGMAALIRSHNRHLTEAQVSALLVTATRDLGDPGRDDIYGHGLIQAGPVVAGLNPDFIPIHRFYNATNGSHFFTPSADEARMVIRTWPHIFAYEGIAYDVKRANAQPLFRFYNRRSSSHFYTASPAERDNVIRTWPHIFGYEGETYKVALNGGTGAVFRFYNVANGGHFYTASPAERDTVRARWPHIYTYEGEAFRLGQ
ncbi:MAG: S8 family serine peptidase [Coriobacteriia bacterium]